MLVRNCQQEFLDIITKYENQVTKNNSMIPHRQIDIKNLREIIDQKYKEEDLPDLLDKVKAYLATMKTGVIFYLFSTMFHLFSTGHSRLKIAMTKVLKRYDQEVIREHSGDPSDLENAMHSSTSDDEELGVLPEVSLPKLKEGSQHIRSASAGW
jgi:hypothetical protein